jgi:hypothetical protein
MFESDGFRYVVLAIDHFPKWTEGRALKNKTAIAVAQFLFDGVVG